MAETIKIICENADSQVFVNMGTSLQEVAGMLSLRNDYPWLAAYVNNEIRELSYRIFSPVTIRFVDITHYEGVRVYQRTLFFALSKAVYDIYPQNRFRIKHSVSKGFYCEIDGVENVPREKIAEIKHRMEEIVRQDIPIVREKVLSSEASEIYRKRGYDDKITLLETHPKLYVTMYRLANMVGNFYGALAPSTKYLYLFDLRKYYNGIYLAFPKRTNPQELEPMVRQEKMFDIFHEYKEWVEIMEVSNIGSLNGKILMGNASELIKVAEAFHEKNMGKIADAIQQENADRGARIVLISGPSSSGKTTFAKRLGIQLRILGLTPVLISLDDYFVDREQTPRDETGDYDYETIDALDLATFNSNLNTLLEGGSVDIPRYDFITGRREYHDKPLKLDDRSVLVVEGIHALNPKLTDHVDDEYKFKVYISALTSISMDDLSRISTTDNRMLRRLVRDSRTRGADAVATLRRWESIRRGEDKYIFPYQENCDVMFNSSLFYEISVLRRYAEPLLHEVPNTVPEYGEARRLLSFIDNFINIWPDEIPPTSILREFIGGSSFSY